MKDAHLHLTAPELQSDETVVNARLKGVSRLLSCASCQKDWRPLQRLAKKYPEVFPFFGIHPWYIDDIASIWKKSIEKILNNNPHAGIGEIGLDKTKPNYARQKDFFIEQVSIAIKYNRTIAVHSVKAHEDLLDILRKYKGKLPRIILHSYSAPLSFIKPFNELGCYFSFSPLILRKKESNATKLLLTVPKERLLIESDAPYGLTSPELLPAFIKSLAEIMHHNPSELEAIIDNNIERILL